MDSDNEEYDEYGNYIGGSLSESEEQAREEADQEIPGVQVRVGTNEHRIILNEDKRYYPAHQEVYPNAEILIEQEDRQTLEVPLVGKVLERKSQHYQPLQPYYDQDFMLNLAKSPLLTRSILVAGHLHHGKTSLLDILIQQAFLHPRDWERPSHSPASESPKPHRWMDSGVDEQQRGVTIKVKSCTLLLPDRIDKHYVLTFLDSPGHTGFWGQVVSGARLADGVLLVVDALEGVMMLTERVIRMAVREGLRIILVINKIDRLILELKLPPEDAYLKLKYIVEEVNAILNKCYSLYRPDENAYVLSPIDDNVLFASAEYAFIFSLVSISEKYARARSDDNFDPKAFSKLLWSDIYFNHDRKKFTKKASTDGLMKRTFVEFVLEPLYKIFSHTVGKDRGDLDTFLEEIGVWISAEEARTGIKKMLKIVLQRYFLPTNDRINPKKPSSCLIDSIITHIPPPTLTIPRLLALYLPASPQSPTLQSCDPEAPLLVNITKLYPAADYKSCYALGRIFSGTLRVNHPVRILPDLPDGSQSSDLFDQDNPIRTIKQLYVMEGRFRHPVQQISAPSLVLIEGIDQSIGEGTAGSSLGSGGSVCTLIDANTRSSEQRPLIGLKYNTQPVLKIAIQPLIPSELPKMVEALRIATRAYSLFRTKIQESGQHVLLGTSELQMDCALHAIRNYYTDIEVRISEPSVLFSETVNETSGIPCYADTPNKKNRIKALAGPLQKGIVNHIERQMVNIDDKGELKNFLTDKFKWDELASTGVWAFGPEKYGTNVLINDSIVNPQTNQKRLDSCRSSIVQGFRWSTREGPLCDEPMRSVKFRVIQAELSENPHDAAPGQMIPTVRRALYSAFLTANPRMMEPIFLTEILCTTNQSIQAAYTVLAKRRGAIQSEAPKPGTPFFAIKAFIPCIDSFGFETDLRVHTVGQAFTQSQLDHWDTLVGDPLDKKIILRPLEALQPHELPREFMIKTRRRKGLNEDVSIVKYFDDINVKQLLRSDVHFAEFL